MRFRTGSILGHALAVALVVSTLAVHAATPVAAMAPLPDDSIYHLHLALVDQEGQPITLAQLRGNVLLVSMFYNSCEFVCPMIIDTMRQTRERLPAALRAQTRMLLVTFDPERDTISVLKTVAGQHDLSSNDWILARTDPSSVRKFAAVLGIQYRVLPNGDFNHTSVILLIDRDGRIVTRSSSVGAVDPALVQALRASVEPARP